MSAHVLLNLLNKLGKRDKMRGLLSSNVIFHLSYDIKITSKSHSLPKKLKFCHYVPV